MARTFDPSNEEYWDWGPLFEAHIRFPGRKFDEFAESEKDEVFALLGVDELYEDCTRIGGKSTSTCSWDSSGLFFGVWSASERFSLAIRVIQNSELPHDLILLVQTRQMEALLGPNWTTAVRECSPNAIELYKDMVGAFRRLHAHVSFESALIGEEVWFYQIPENARGIYIPTPAAEAIDPGRCTVPREDHLAVKRAGDPGLRIIPLDVSDH